MEAPNTPMSHTVPGNPRLELSRCKSASAPSGKQGGQATLQDWHLQTRVPHTQLGTRSMHHDPSIQPKSLGPEWQRHALSFYLHPISQNL